MKIDPKGLRHIAGVGSSEVVQYDGAGIYFLDKVQEGEWILELYPDIVQVDDPFKQPDRNRRVFTIDPRPHTLALDLPDVKGVYAVQPAMRYRIKAGESKPMVEATLPLRPESETWTIFDPKEDYATLLFTRGGFFSPNYDNRPSEAGNLRLYAEDLTEKEAYWFPADIAAQHYVGDRMIGGATQPRALAVRVRALTPTTDRMRIQLNESEGACWGTEITIGEEWQRIEVSFTAFTPDRVPQLPQDWPGISPYYRKSVNQKGKRLCFEQLENLYFSLRGEDFPDQGSAPKGVEIERVELLY